MGIFHSTTRIFLASKPHDEEGHENPGCPNLQNRCKKSHGDHSSLKTLIFFSSIYKAAKGLLQKVFNFSRPRKAAAHFLPIQNQTEPLLISSAHSISENTTVIFESSSLTEDDEAQCVEQNYSNIALVSSDYDQEIVEDIAPANFPSSSSSSSSSLFCGEENYSAARNEIDHDAVASLPQMRCSYASIAVRNLEIAQEISTVQEEREGEEKSERESSFGELRKIKHYSNRHRILLVGEGDFSFSACLAVAFGSATNIIATSLNNTAKMGILHSTARFLTSRQKDEDEEEVETPIHLDLQNHYISFTISIYKALKCLLRRAGSIFYTAKLRKAADPLLPVRNPSTEPLLVQTPTISSPATTFSGEESDYDGDGDVDRVLWCEDSDGNDSRITDHRVVVSVPELTRSLASASSSEQTMCAAVFVQVERENEEEEEREEVEIIKNVVSRVLGEERWIKHYSSRHRILLVGEGDFSFSACLAHAFRWASNIIATSLDSQAFLKENYCNALTNIEELRSRGGQVMHGINATAMANHELLGQLRFDRVIFNFPYAGLSGLKNLPRESQLRIHQKLVGGFLENAREMISEKGEIHITHKTNGFHGEWRVVAVACRRGLRLIDAVKFNHYDYPRYNTKCGFGGNRYFNCNPSKTYKFGL